MPRWRLNEAKTRLSEILQAATADGPQEIMVRGEPAAVIVSWADFQRLKGGGSFVDFMRSSPLCEANVTLERDTSPARVQTCDLSE